MHEKTSIAQKTPQPAVQPAAETEPLQPAEDKLIPGTAIQCSLSVGAPDDPLEQEADQMADTVMRMPLIQRKCAHCEEEEKAQRKPLAASITPFIQTKDDGEGTTSAALTSRINNSRGSGASLDDGTKTFMESRFGNSFSNVKIHTGNESVMMNRELNAKAFTVGNDIYFNQNEYNPQSDSGKHLLAHELTHVIQQGHGQQQVSRADYKIGRSDVHIDYGNVVYHDNINEYESEIESRYTAWTGQPATNIHARIGTLTNPQKRWVLYAIDLLTDNPLANLNKAGAVNRLITYAPSAMYAPLTGYDYRNPVFNFENEVLRVSGWFELSLTSGLRRPSATDQGMLDIAYNHANPGATGSSCPTTRTAALDEPKLRTDIPAIMNTYLQARVNALAGRATQTQNISDILPLADIVQREALQFFRPYIGRGSNKHFLQNWQYSAHLQSSTAPGAIPNDVRLAYLNNRATGEADRTGLFQQTNFDSRCQADSDVFDNIVETMNLDPTVTTQLNTILSWQSFTGHDSQHADTVINLQSLASQNACEARWASINTLCHEIMHAYVHPGFTGLSNGRRIITEGFTEILGDELFEEIRGRATNNPVYRAQFEGGINAAACRNTPIPASRTEYGDDGRFAGAILGIVGPDRFRAAYFLGRTTLAGLQPKLETGSSGDVYEKEADAIADHIIYNEDKQQAAAVSKTNGLAVQRTPDKPPTYNQALVSQAKARLKILEPRLAALEGRKIEIEAERLRTMAERDMMDEKSDDPFKDFKKPVELEMIKNLNRLPLEIIVTGNHVAFNVKFHVRFENPAMSTKFEEVKTTLQAGIDLVWKQTLGGVFSGRSFTINPSVTLIDMATPRDQNFWLITVRAAATPVNYPGCKMEQPAPNTPPTSVTDATCDGGVMSIPPTHTNKPGILGHELLHLFGLVDRYGMFTDIVPGKKPVTTLSPTRNTGGRKDPLGAQDGTILQEDLGFLFDKLGVYSKEEDRSTLGLGTLKREVMRLQEIVRLGYDPHSFIPSIIRKDFNDKMFRDAENL